MKFFRYILKIIFLSIVFKAMLFANRGDIIESQPQVLFKHKSLYKIYKKRELVAVFNNAVLYMEQKEFTKAIELFNISVQVLKVPSILNIGISYYKLGNNQKALKALKQIYNIKELKNEDKFSYFSAAFYLYKITNDYKYIQDIEKVATKAKHLKYEEQSLFVDTLILLKKYKKALKYLKTLDGKNSLKEALIYLKLKNYIEARVYLDKAYEEVAGDDAKNDVLWFKTYRDLKANDLSNLQEELVKIGKRKRFFQTHKKLKFKLFFNKDKFSPKQYFDQIINLDFDTKLDFVYYFAPFIFEEYDSLDRNMKKSFILRDKSNLEELNTVIKYNSDFLKVVKLDSVRRVQILHDMVKVKYDAASYEYYNLALSYAQIFDYNNAYRYFKKAYDLEHGNKLYSVMLLLTAKRLNKTIAKDDKKLLIDNIVSNSGTYRYLAKYLYKSFIDSSVKLDKRYLSNKRKKSIFFRALYFFDNIKKHGIQKNEPLLVEYSKDPLVYLLSLIAKDENETQFEYISRLQDSIPKVYNNFFINNSFVIESYYIKVLRALGLFHRTNFVIEECLDPSYLYLKSIVDLYKGYPKSTIKIMNYLQKKYELTSVHSNYILTAAYLSEGQDDLAYAILSELEFIYKNSDAAFFAGIKLIQNLKIDSASQYFKYKLKGKLIDFKLLNFDKYLQEL